MYPGIIHHVSEKLREIGLKVIKDILFVSGGLGKNK